MTRTFFDNIRAINSSLAFASLAADINDTLAKNHKGVYTFQAHGAVYHNIGPVHVPEGQQPKFAQIYIYDGDEIEHSRNELESRIRHNKQLDTWICRSILLGGLRELFQDLFAKMSF